MQTIKKLSLILLAAYVLLLAQLVGCATRTPLPDVGVVVVAPKVKLPPPPVIVQVTEPKPVGYFQQELLNYSNGSPARQTTSTPPSQAARQTPTP